MEKTNDGEWEDSQLSTYEVEEEYNSVIEMQGKMSDKEIMYENYTQDSDSNHSNSSISCLYNLSNKGKTIFHLNWENPTDNKKIHGNSCHNDAFVDLPVNHQNQHPVNGQSLPLDNHVTDNHDRLHMERDVNGTCKMVEQDYGASKKSVCTIEVEQIDNNGVLDKSPTDIAEEKIKDIHDTKLEKLGQKENCLSQSSFGDVLNPEAYEESTAKILLSEICCAMCPRRFGSLQDLRKHMHLHTDVQKVHVGKLKLLGNTTLGYLPTSVISTVKNSSSHYPETISEHGHENNVDILHNLLGVESSTIDQIFEYSDSAASLLGV